MIKLILLLFFCFFVFIENQGQSNRFFKSIENLKFSPKEVFVRNGNSTEVKLSYKLEMYEGKKQKLNLSKKLNFNVKGAANSIEAHKKHIIVKAKENSNYKDTIILEYSFNKRKDIYFSDTIITLNYDKHKEKILNEIIEIEPTLNEEYITNIKHTKFGLKIKFENGKISTLSEYSYFLNKSDFNISTEGPIEYNSYGITAKRNAFINGKAYLIVSLKNNPLISKRLEVKINHNIKYTLDFDEESTASRGRNGEDGRAGRIGQYLKEEYTDGNWVSNRQSSNVINGENGYSGLNGRNGNRGENAPNINIYVKIVDNESGEKALEVKTQKNENFYTRYLPLDSDFSVINIYSRGGDGGNGGRGGDGGRGGNSEELQVTVKTSTKDPNDRNEVKIQKTYYYYKGNAGDGGNGGRGGDGGDGGRGGDVSIFYSQEAQNYLTKIKVYNEGGDGGNRGRVGCAGQGGTVESSGRRRNELMNEGRQGIKGIDGERGYAGREGQKGNVNYILQQI
jgi:hypothetical protein